MNFSKLWDGAKALFSTSQSLEAESCCKKFEKRTLDKMLLLIEENKRLKEEIRIRDLQDNPKHDV
jgi:hypothetical protein